jgi:hypothetical protein
MTITTYKLIIFLKPSFALLLLISLEPAHTTTSFIHVFIDIIMNFVWNREELPDQWKGSIILPFYEKGDKIGCSNYC